MTVVSKGIVFPWFTLENHESLRPWLGLKEMRDTLQKGGFTIKHIFDIEGQFLDPAISFPPPNNVRFEVSLPGGWSLVEGFDNYGFMDRTLLQLLDAKGYLRGHVSLDWDTGLQPEKAEFFCRYALNPLNCNFTRVERPENSITDVVIDRTAVDHKKPAEFPIVAFHHSRLAKKGPFMPPPTDEFNKSLGKEAERIKAGRPLLDPPVYRWLHENHSDWRNPFAYW